MKRVYVAAVLTTVSLALALPPWAEAASKYNACGLLTAAELKAAVNAGVDKTDEHDVVTPSGPYKGETVSTCTWSIGATFVSVSVIRGPQTAEQRAGGLSGLRATEGLLVKKGWTVEPAKIPGADCNAYKPPASEGGMRPFASCIMQNKGLAFWLGASGASTLTPQQVKALADKAAARLP